MNSEKPAACEMRCRRGRNCQCFPVGLSRNDLIRYQLAQQQSRQQQHKPSNIDVSSGTTSQPQVNNPQNRQGASVGQPCSSDSSTGTPNSDGKPGRPGIEGQPDGSNGTPGPATEFPCGAPGPLGPVSLFPGANKDGIVGQHGAGAQGFGDPPPGSIGQSAFPTQATSQVRPAAAYVQWGNSRCAQDSVFIYGGFIAGPHVTNIDLGTDLQCMPRQRDSSTSATGRRLSTNGDSYIGVVQFDGPPDISTSDSVIRCSLCYVPGKNFQVMIPGRVTCPGNLKHIYNGWLMEAGRRGVTEERVLSLSNQICMARDAQIMPGLADNSTIKLSHVRFGSSCGTAGSPCSSYSDSQALPCCVCTQK